MRLEQTPAFSLLIARQRPATDGAEGPFDGRSYWDAQLSNPETFRQWMRTAEGVSMRMFGNKQDAEDAAASAIETILRRANGFQGGNPRAWFLRVLTNKGNDLLRSRMRRPTTSLNQLIEESGDCFDVRSHDEEPDKAARGAIARGVFESVARKLPENQRRVVKLSLEEDLSYEDVTEKLKIPLGTLKSRLSRLRTELRKGLAAQGVGFDFLDD